MLWENKPQASVSTAFSSSPKPSRVFVSITLDKHEENICQRLRLFSECFAG